MRQAQIRRVRRHALALVKSGSPNYVTPSPLTQKLAGMYYTDATEQELIAMAQRILRAARLTTFVPQTKADAVSIIEGIRLPGDHMHDESRVSQPDVLVNNVGTLYTFCPLSLRAKEWIDERVQGNAQWFGHALIVEHRYAWGLAQGMKDDGLVLA